MKTAKRKWIGRIAVIFALLLLALAVVGAWVAWRVTRIPAWYAAAIDCPIEPAYAAEQTVLIGFRNWIARSSAGNPDQLPESERRYDITLTDDQINALLAKWTDNLHGEIGGLEKIRVHLGDDELTLQARSIEHGRVVGLRIRSGAGGDAKPNVWIDSVRVGEQGVPLSWANAKPLAKLKSALAALAQNDHLVGIDAHGVATPTTFKAYSLWALQSLAAGNTLEPIVCVSPQLSEQDVVFLALSAAHADGQKLTLTFQLLSLPEQKRLIEQVHTILSGEK